jgi:hypothetical protein
MSAQAIYDRVPLGSFIRSDGTPRPPERFKKKLSAWENNNNGGRLVRKSAPHTVGAHTTPASITLHQGDFGGAGIVVLEVFKIFSVNSPLTFTVIERPKPGMVRVLNRAGDDAELLHLTDTRAAAEAWLASHHFSDAVLDEGAAPTAPSGTGVPTPGRRFTAAPFSRANPTRTFGATSSAITPSAGS